MLEMLDGLSEDAWEGVDSKSKADVDRFLEDLKARVAKFGLTLNEDKTRVLQFGRFAAELRARQGLPKPPKFEFLGFTHSVGDRGRTAGSS